MGNVYFTDNQQIPAGSPYGGPSRILAPRRFGAALCQELPDGRRIFKFSVKAGDACGEDSARKIYKDNPKSTPNRCMQAFEKGVNELPYGKLITIERSINIAPGAITTAPWFVLDQLNQEPLPGNDWQSPCIATGFEAKDGKEFITFDMHLAGPDGAAKVVNLAKYALPTRRKLNIKTEFINSAGQPGGLARVFVDGVQLCDYQDPTGFPGYRGPYFARGAYRSPYGKGEFVEVHHEGLKIPAPA